MSRISAQQRGIQIIFVGAPITETIPAEGTAQIQHVADYILTHSKCAAE